MARPKVWTGSAWVDLTVWTGSKWKGYTDPVYDKVANGADYQFASNAQGWTAGKNSDWDFPPTWSGGNIYASADAGLMGYVSLKSPGAYPGDIDGTRRVKGQFSVRVVSGSGATQPNPIEYSITLNADTEVRNTYTMAPGTDTGYVTRLTPETTIKDGTLASLTALADGGALSGYGSVTLYLAWARIYDVVTGQPLMQLGSAGTEGALVWDGSSWI